MNEVFAWVFGIVAAVIPGFGVAPEPAYNGYVEADYVYMAPASPGRIETLNVREGDVVGAGQLLFALEADQQQAVLRAAEARRAAAEATWLNLTTGSRAEEIDVIRASLAQAMAEFELAQSTLERTQKLKLTGNVSQAKVDADKATLARANAQVAQLKAQLAVAELPARSEQVVAAEANLDAARADADRARLDLADRQVMAPVQGIVERVYFRAGEVAATGLPVVAILPPGQLKARFYIPETARAQFRIGDIMRLDCDNCPPGLTAVISRMTSDPQYTPPIIYSRDERSRLVFMAEAVLDENATLLPGQPVTLRVMP